MAVNLTLAVLFAALIAIGVGLIYLPAGLVAAGIEGLCGLYVARYMEAHSANT